MTTNKKQYVVYKIYQVSTDKAYIGSTTIPQYVKQTPEEWVFYSYHKVKGQMYKHIAASTDDDFQTTILSNHKTRGEAYKAEEDILRNIPYEDRENYYNCRYWVGGGWSKSGKVSKPLSLCKAIFGTVEGDLTLEQHSVFTRISGFLSERRGVKYLRESCIYTAKRIRRMYGDSFSPELFVSVYMKKKRCINRTHGSGAKPPLDLTPPVFQRRKPITFRVRRRFRLIY